MSHRFASPYAKALMRTLPDNADAKRVRDEVASYADAQKAAPQLGQMASNPAVPLEVKERLLGEVCDLLELGREARGFLGLLLRNFRLAHLDVVMPSVDKLLNRRLGITTAEVSSATPLDSDQKLHLEQVLNRVLDSKVEFTLKTDPKLLGAPKRFDLTVRDVRLAAGAEFVIVYCGDIMTMPGLPKVPAAEYIDIEPDGRITGLF